MTTVLYNSTNKHGVRGQIKAWRSGHTFVPDACISCFHFELGEPGEYGTTLTPPYCALNLWFPTRKGTCKKQEPRP